MFNSYVSLPEGRSHQIPFKHHFPMVFLWFSYGFHLAPWLFQRDEISSPSFTSELEQSAVLRLEDVVTKQYWVPRVDLAREPSRTMEKTIGKWWFNGVLWDLLIYLPNMVHDFLNFAEVSFSVWAYPVWKHRFWARWFWPNPISPLLISIDGYPLVNVW